MNSSNADKQHKCTKTGVQIHMEDTERCCYICVTATDEPTIRPCGCDVVAHPSCVIKAIREVPSHHDRCPVCTRPYKKKYTYARSCRVRPCHEDVCVAVMMFIVVLMTPVVFFIATMQNHDVCAHWTGCFLFLFYSTVSCGIIGWCIGIHLFRGCCCYRAFVVNDITIEEADMEEA